MKKTKAPSVAPIILPPHRRWSKFLISMGVIGIIVGVGFWFTHYSKQESSNSIAEAVSYAPSINGNMVDEQLAELRPMAVVIENSPEARPQSGLSDAEVVYEMVSEGGITRFLAIFQSRQPESIGPVRSARPYFNFLANLWGAALVHSGGSTQALSELSSGVHRQLYDINEFFYGKYFTRDSRRSSPHNLYTTSEDLRELLIEKTQTAWQPIQVWEFESTPVDQLVTEISNITIPFSGPLFAATYLYDPTTNSYQRSLTGRPHIDRNNDLQISAKNVIIHLTDITPTGDELLTMNIRLTGSGPCYLFASGKLQECRWSYADGKHDYRDADGNPLKLQPGPTWIHIFPQDRAGQLVWN
ncbi:MAG TPA: DUF3048 domain-containing protein [Candidatus Doudnabacteria bacterium]|nr:DUF3048 domain-containing protein [Candidatus Doudnabacteria bacterium]